MQAKGTRQERETIINFNKEKDIASVWTASQVTYRRLKEMGYNPTTDDERSANFSVPKTCVSIRKPRKLTEKQKEALKKHGFSSGDPRESREITDDPAGLDAPLAVDFSE